LAIRTTVKPFSRSDWERDLLELDQKRQLSQADRKWFEERVAQLAEQGKMDGKQADERRFKNYWRDRPRKARVLAIGMPLVGVAASVAAVSWIRPSWVVTGIWLLITLPLGGSMCAALGLDYAMRRNAQRFAGRELQAAAGLIKERLDLIPIEARPSFGQRLRQLFM
jgi:hypothetical protein